MFNLKLDVLNDDGHAWYHYFGIDHLMLTQKVDSFMHYGISDSIFPGAQLLIAKEGKIIFPKR